MPTKKLQSLEKALRLLKLFSSLKNELRVREIAEQLGYHQSSLQRLITTLEAEGFLERSLENPGHYRLGVEALLLGNAAKDSLSLRAAAKPYLEALSEKTRETIHLGVTDAFRVYYLDKIDSTQSIRMVTHVGQHIPIHTSSMGKSMMAYMRTEELDKGIAVHGLPSLTPKTITERKQLDAELERVRRQGCAYDDEEWSIGVKCVGAPIFNDKGEAVAAVSCSGPAQRFTEEAVAGFAEAVKDTARAISRRLGYQAREKER